MLTKAPFEFPLEQLLSLVVDIFPEDNRDELMSSARSFRLPLVRLAAEVLEAEDARIPFAEAILLSQRFSMMARIHFGASDVIQWEIPNEYVSVVRETLDRASNGHFDQWRQVVFEMGRRHHDPAAALCRFALWQAIRLNLLIMNWNDPMYETSGVLEEESFDSEETLRELLADTNEFEADDRPLHVLVAEASLRSGLRMRCALDYISQHSADFERLMTNVEALERVRELRSRDAVVFYPGAALGPMESQQIADRYPNHFRSAGAVDTARSRFLHGPAKAPGLRLIDVIQEAM